MHNGKGKNHQAYLWQYGTPGGSVVFDLPLRYFTNRWLCRVRKSRRAEDNSRLLLGTPRLIRDLLRARACIDGKELVDALDDVNSGSVFGVKFNGSVAKFLRPLENG
jgi:hypothetical protein